MDLLLPLISLLLVTGGGDGWVASFADAATTVAPNSEEIPKAYWEAVLPGIPMPPAIINLLLAQQNVHTSPEDVTSNPNNLKFIKVPRKVGSNHEKLKLEYEEDPHKVTMTYRSEHEEDPHKVTMSYGSEHEEDPHKVTMSYGSDLEMDQNMASMGHATHFEVKGEGSHHAHFPNHNNKKQADVFFFHDMLRPGYVITPTIPPTTSLPTLLPHQVAKSIPFSIKHLSEIIAMFAPMSLTMAREIRWTLDTCDHPRKLPGQKAGCSTSLESLTKLVFSLHGTEKVRAFSATNLPVDVAGTSALRGMYNVTTVRKLSESSEIVTCHDLMYPYAVYYCHTANPTVVYTVALESVDSTMMPAMIEALAVCHLDTSRWSPKNPFFELHNLKPGDVAVCHFLTKLSIVWVRDGEQGDTNATAC